MMMISAAPKKKPPCPLTLKKEENVAGYRILNNIDNTHTFRLDISVMAIILGHCPGIGLAHMYAAMACVQNPEIHGTATPTFVIQLR